MGIPHKITKLEVTAARLAAYSYFKDLEKLKNTIQRFSDFLTLVDNRDIQVIVTLVGDKTVLTFRGVELDQIEDIRTALNFRPLLNKYGHLHYGFSDAVDFIWPQIMPWIKNSKSVVFSGHSMGGALAQIAANRFVLEGGTTPQTIVFGAPKIGLLEVSAQDLQIKKYCLVGDLVPLLPFNWMGPYKDQSRAGFRLLYPDGRMKDEPLFLFHRILTWRSLLAAKWNLFEFAWQRHSATAYAQALQLTLTKQEKMGNKPGPQ